MPEGHAIHLYASEHRKLFEQQSVTATSPQGRFAAGAARINGRTLLAVDSHGKHLFYRWRRAETLHVHLGLYGKFRSFRSYAPAPTPATRLVLSTDTAEVHLAGPTVCELIEPSAEDRIRARLGPDPLQAGSAGSDAATFAANLRRRRIPIGAALLDQAVIAGLGNIYRAEILFLTGLDPQIPANEIDQDKVAEIWDLSVKLLRRGVRHRAIVTVKRMPPRASRRDRRKLVHVYQRDRLPCRRCGGQIMATELAGRRIWWCPACQAR